MTEDDIYRTSTQYKLWSYTLETLASLRASTNSRAAARVKDAIRRVRAEKARGKDASQQDVTSSDVDCLTVDEEQKLVGFYCIKAMDLGEFCDFPTNVKVCPRFPDSLRERKTDWNTGYSSAVPQALLPFQFPNDIPP